ncbi:MAG: hypothetical protein JWN46_2197 [Acidimicrobiales bacterium]|nr:hypothetical protein [Acidimicrobiales bacterium]
MSERCDDEFDELYEPDVRAALDDWEPSSGPAERTLPSRLTSWSRSSMLGLVMTGWANGLQEVLDPRDAHPIVIEVDADGQPHGLPIELILDPDDPRGSLCIVHRTPPPPVV